MIGTPGHCARIETVTPMNDDVLANLCSAQDRTDRTGAHRCRTAGSTSTLDPPLVRVAKELLLPRRRALQYG